MSNFRIPASSPDGSNPNQTLVSDLDAMGGSQLIVAAGAITIKEGTVFIGSAGALALTLAAPTPGLPSAAGDDGKTLDVVDITGHAHTVTTPANAINTNKHIATSAGNIGDICSFHALNGVWYSNPANTGFTIT